MANAKKKTAQAADAQASQGGLLTEEQIRAMSEDEYMNDAQLAFFRQRLLEQRAEVLEREREIRERLNHRESAADPVDRAATEEERWLDLRLRDRESKLLRKIDSASLVERDEFLRQLNEHLGTDWPHRVGKIIAAARRTQHTPETDGTNSETDGGC